MRLLTKVFKKFSAAIILSAILISLVPTKSFAMGRVADSEPEHYPESQTNVQRVEKHLETVRNKNVAAYQRATLTYNGKNIGNDSLIINGKVYVSLRSFINTITNMNVSYDSKRKTLYVNGQGLELSVSDGAYAVYANGRILFSMTPSAVMSNGRMYTPLSSVAKALGLSLSENVSASSATLKGSVRALQHGSSYYREDAVYWLSRIISAESQGESLIGQIAVGNIVMNRVLSKDFPNTIWGVIFDRKYGVQFSPVANGTIYNAPSQTSVTAAKICLEGFSLSEEVLFFLEPRISTSSWIPKTRKYVFSIGHHDFYS